MSQPHVMVVDDDDAIRESISGVLEDCGYVPIGAANGQEALCKLAASCEPPCVILLDLMMPVMNGWMFRQEQLRRPELSTIPVVVISAQLDSAAKDLHADALLRKPIRLADLLRVVEERCPCDGSLDGQ